jgi:hypothetical protein
METVELDMTDPTSIDQVAAKLIAEHPDLNVPINNAGRTMPSSPIPALFSVSCRWQFKRGGFSLRAAIQKRVRMRQDGFIKTRGASYDPARNRAGLSCSGLGADSNPHRQKRPTVDDWQNLGLLEPPSRSISTALPKTSASFWARRPAA